MSDILTKDTVIITIPGTPAVAPIPSSPAYDENITTTVWGIIGYVLITDVHGHPIYAPVYGSITTTVVIHHPAVTGTPGSPGTAAITIIDPLPGWNAGAVSIGPLLANSMFQFSLDSNNVGVVCGLNEQNLGTSYSEINYGILCETGLYRIIENGLILTTHASFATSDVFTLAQLGDELSYWKNSTKVYTSPVRTTGQALFADCALYLGGDRIL